jgi:ubiquinone/menaquinone biosynthesis C-methylase UbiE
VNATGTAMALDWSSPDNVEAYARFADTHDWYDRLAADLLVRAELVPGSVVIDLCCGAGALTRSLLEYADPESVVAVDASAAMLRQARHRTADPRVSWRRLRAEHLGNLGAASADAVLCSAAMWELPMPDTLAAVATVLRPGGRLAFNAADEAGHPPDPWLTALQAAGLELEHVDRTDHALSGGDILDWLSLPVFFPGPAGLDEDTRRQQLRARGVRPEPGRAFRFPWVTVMARKPER